MHVLFIYAHPEPTSFTAALRDAGAAALRAAGHTVEVSDLYAEHFDPVAGRHDFRTVADASRFHYQTEQGHAHGAHGFAPDLVREQERFLKADLVVWLFPIWWGGMPAIMKGWFDRVLAYGFAYADGKRYDTGFFPDKRGILCLATGGTRDRFSTRVSMATSGRCCGRRNGLWSSISLWKRSSLSSLTARRASMRNGAPPISTSGAPGSPRSQQT